MPAVPETVLSGQWNNTNLWFIKQTVLYETHNRILWHRRHFDGAPETRSWDEFNLRKILWITGVLLSGCLPAYLFSWLFVCLSLYLSVWVITELPNFCLCICLSSCLSSSPFGCVPAFLTLSVCDFFFLSAQLVGRLAALDLRGE